MQNCSECQESIDFICTTCQTFSCKECISKHKEENCYLDKPKTYFSRLLAAKRENIEEHFENYNKMDKQLLILKGVLNKQELDTSIQEIIKKDIENMESYCRNIDEAEEKLERYEEELKKEVPIIEMLEKIKGLEDSFDVPKLDDDTIEILLIHNAYVEPDNKNDKGEELKQTERQLQICLINQIDNFINKIQELATKYVDDANRLKQDMKNLEANYKQMKQKYADEEAELKKGMSEGYKEREKLEKKDKVNEQKKKFEELLSEYTKLDTKYKSQNSELDSLKSKLSSIEQSNENLVANIKTVEEPYKKEKQALSNLIEEIKKDKEECRKYMEEVKDSLKKRINELVKPIKEVNEKVGLQAKKASKIFGKLRELCKNTISDVDYISNEKSSLQVKIDWDNNDIDQIYINLKEIIKRMNNAYLNIKTEKETEIKRLEKEISKSNRLIESCKITIKSMEDSITNKEVEFTKYMNYFNQRSISFKEMKEENTRLTKVEDDLRKQLEDSKNNESNLTQRYNTLQQDCNTLNQEKSKLMENIKTLENDFKNLKDENKRIKRELEDSNTKIRSLKDTDTRLEKDNASLKENLENYKQENESLKNQIKEEDNKLPIVKHKGNVAHEENKAKKSKGVCNIKLIDDIHSHEIFTTGTLKKVTKENVYEKKSIESLSKICCFCLTGKAEMKAVCVYHSTCKTCFNKAERDCKLCKVSGFKPLDFGCDNCKNIVSLSDINILICMYKNCNYCIKTGTSNTSKVTRYKLPVRVL